MKEWMSGRDRIMAALNKEPVDRLPWVPFLNPYAMAGLPLSVPHYVADAMEYFGCDVFARHGKVFDVHVSYQDGSLVKPIYAFDRGDRITGYATPLGEIHTRERCMGSGRMPTIVKHLIENLEDLEIFKYVLENSIYDFVPNYEGYMYEDQAIGDRGIISVAMTSMSPIQELMEVRAGVENTIYLIADDLSLFCEVIEMMHKRNKSMVEYEARSPAMVFISYENTSSTTMSPDMFIRFCQPYLDDYADIYHRYGKLNLIHACGKLSRLSKLVSGCHFDGVVDIAPAPTGDIELWEAHQVFKDKVVAGGIDCTTFALAKPEQCYDRFVEVINRVKPFKGVLIGSGDSVPYGTTVENLQAMRSALEEYGVY